MDRLAPSPEALSRLQPVLLAASRLAIQDAALNALPFEVFELELNDAESLEFKIGKEIEEAANGATLVGVCRRRKAPAGINDYKYVGPNGRSRCIRVYAVVDSWEDEDRVMVTYGWDQHIQASRSLAVTMERSGEEWIVVKTGYTIQS